MINPIIGWNNTFLEAVRLNGGPPGPIARIGAMLHLTLYDVVNTFAGTHEAYLENIPTPKPGADVNDAADYAAYAILREAYRNQPASKSVKTLLKAELKKLGKSAKDDNDSRDFGATVAGLMMDRRMNDNSDDATPFPVVDTPGQWTPTGSGDAATPNWGKVKPFGNFNMADFRPPQPAGYTDIDKLLASEEYAAQYNEVMRLGSANSSERTPEQTEIAFFWANDLDGTSKPPGQLYTLTQIVARNRKLTMPETARLFGLISMTMADAAIVAWDVKYNEQLHLWRPESAIRYNFSSPPRNPRTLPDPYWEPLSARSDGTRFSPNFPAYVSGHATFGGAHAAMMRCYFGTDHVSFELTTEDPHATLDQNGVRKTRHFNSFSAAALENARSRVYLGVHYQWDGDYGFDSGSKLGVYLFKNFLRENTPVPVNH